MEYHYGRPVGGAGRSSGKGQVMQSETWSLKRLVRLVAVLVVILWLATPVLASDTPGTMDSSGTSSEEFLKEASPDSYPQNEHPQKELVEQKGTEDGSGAPRPLSGDEGIPIDPGDGNPPDRPFPRCPTGLKVRALWDESTCPADGCPPRPNAPLTVYFGLTYYGYPMPGYSFSLSCSPTGDPTVWDCGFSSWWMVDGDVWTISILSATPGWVMGTASNMADLPRGSLDESQFMENPNMPGTPLFTQNRDIILADGTVLNPWDEPILHGSYMHYTFGLDENLSFLNMRMVYDPSWVPPDPGPGDEDPGNPGGGEDPGNPGGEEDPGPPGQGNEEENTGGGSGPAGSDTPSFGEEEAGQADESTNEPAQFQTVMPPAPRQNTPVVAGMRPFDPPVTPDPTPVADPPAVTGTASGGPTADPRFSDPQGVQREQLPQLMPATGAPRQTLPAWFLVIAGVALMASGVLVLRGGCTIRLSMGTSACARMLSRHNQPSGERRT